MIVVPPCGWVAAIDRGGTVSVGPKAAVAEFLLSRPVAAVRARHRDRPLIGAFVFDGRNGAVVPKKREGESLKGDWIRGSSCCLPRRSCWASGLRRLSRRAL